MHRIRLAGSTESFHIGQQITLVLGNRETLWEPTRSGSDVVLFLRTKDDDLQAWNMSK
jgi:hypothetical protein